jgi:hypothetical protein
MKMNRWSVSLLTAATASVLLSLGAGTAAADVKVKYRGATAVAIAHLANTKTCNSDTRATVVGRVIKREFASDGMRLQNFVYEKSDGSRGIINVDFDEIDNEGQIAMRTGIPAIQQLTKVGRRFRADVFLCGAAESVMILENLS